MIARLRGAIVELEGDHIVVECAGVGYEVNLPESVALTLPGLGEEVTLFIRQIFREDGQYLYGFAERGERRLFDMLTETKGCGPKIALALLGQVGVDNVCAAILNQDAKALARANGVGIRIAERIIVELKDKISQEALIRKIEAMSSSSDASQPDDDPLLDALMGLGYKRQEAEAAASGLPSNLPLEERLRDALRLLKR